MSKNHERRQKNVRLAGRKPSIKLLCGKGGIVTGIEKPDPLLEWNRLNKENAEHNFVSALFRSMAQTSPIVDKFSLWLLAGTGASGALLVSQIQAVLPHLTAKGFKICLICLVISAVFGFLAKYKSLRCQIQSEMQEKLLAFSEEIFEAHEKSESEIKEHAERRGIEIQTDIDFSNIITEFSKPFPRMARWAIKRQAKNSQGDRQAGYHAAIKPYFGQLQYTLWQSVSFLAFLCAAAWFAQAT
jgi:hypothetical protein